MGPPITHPSAPPRQPSNSLRDGPICASLFPKSITSQAWSHGVIYRIPEFAAAELHGHPSPRHQTVIPGRLITPVATRGAAGAPDACPENLLQASENMESAPDFQPRDSRTAIREAIRKVLRLGPLRRPPAQAAAPYAPDSRPENLPQASENMESAPGFQRRDPRTVMPGGEPKGSQARSLRRPRPKAAAEPHARGNRPEKMLQTIEKMESAPDFQPRPNVLPDARFAGSSGGGRCLSLPPWVLHARRKGGLKPLKYLHRVTNCAWPASGSGTLSGTP